MGYGLGVDLGTTYTAAAVRVGDRVDVVRLGGRRPEIPSLVYIRADGEVLVGEAAERRGAADLGRLAREFKRRVGDPVPILVGGAPYSAHALTARLLKEVYAIVGRLQDGPPDDVTVTHPANWGPYKRELLEQAIQLAELEGVRLRSEPEAAAIQYAAGERVQPGEVVAVYDLGGGTFDAAVLRKTTTGFTLLGKPEGIEQLGGIDFDEAVFGHVVATLGSHLDGLDPDDEETTTALARLRRDCVEAKEGLTFDTEVMIPVALPGLHTRIRLNRSEFEAMIAPALSDTLGAMRRALRSAEVTPAEVKSVLLAGGSSRIPLVGQLLGTEFGRPVVLDPHPEHSIALGAARVAGPAATAFDGSFPGGPPTGRVTPAAGPAQPTSPHPSEGRASAPAAAALAAAVAAGSATAPPAPTTPRSTTPTTPHSTVPAAQATPGATGTAATAPVTPGGAIPPVPAPDASTLVGTASVPVAKGTATGPPTGTAPITYREGRATATPPAPTGPWAPARKPSGLPRVSRRALLLGIPAVAAVAGTGTVVAVLAMSDGPPSGAQSGSGPPSGQPTGSATPSPSPSVDPNAFPVDQPILFRRDEGGEWPTASRSGIYRMMPGSGERLPLAVAGHDILPQWSPDRTRFAFTRRTGTSWQVWTMNADGSGATKVIDRIRPGSRVSWAPDGRRLVFVTEVNRIPQFAVITVGSSRPVQLTTSTDGKDDPAWDPTGDLLAAWSSRDGQAHLYLVSAVEPGARWQRLTSGAARTVDPAWSPDGKRIAYTRSADGRSNIWVINRDGRGNRAVTTGDERDMDPTWSPDGKWIAFTRGQLNSPTIHAIRPDGKDLRRLTTPGGREGHPAW
ncbi:Hsp70 family protein [Plantactinospora solaniradicis]|uniref:Hsp70 family protein n=1 Tax=Plantactinospora solaniradicis TaxID=1723736 RepID=A0ABW1K4A8_9ACTN